jgi:ATP-dependent RNA helicase DDX51/DBP6
MAKKARTKQSGAAPGMCAAPSASGEGGRDGAGEDMNCDGEGGDGRMLDSEEEREKTAKQPRKKKQHRKKGESDALNPAEDGEVERPRKRHKLRSSDASPGRSRSTTPVPSSPVSSSPEQPAESQTVLDHRPRTPTPLPSTLQRFPLPSRPHAPEKAELASQGLDRALAGAQLVDPLLSTPLSPDEDGNDITGLSARTLRRLRDLGIVELFAGVYRVAFGKPHFLKMYNF